MSDCNGHAPPTAGDANGQHTANSVSMLTLDRYDDGRIPLSGHPGYYAPVPIVSTDGYELLSRGHDKLRARLEALEELCEATGKLTPSDRAAAKRMIERDQQRRELGHEELALLRKVAGC